MCYFQPKYSSVTKVFNGAECSLAFYKTLMPSLDFATYYSLLLLL